MKYTIIAIAALSGTAFGQTVVNGDFSDTSGMTSESNGAYFVGTPAGWTSNNRDVAVLTLSWGGNPAGFSSNYIDVDNSSPVTLTQDISGFTVGKEYTLSFDWGSRGGNYDMTVAIGGKSASHLGSGFVPATADSFTFTAGAATETLAVSYNNTNGSAWTGFNSTNFTVTPVPEPSSAALLGLGGLALILRRRK